ncbi:MAG: CDGSH iron-sulfur domain-containing protein [bacterium]
MKNPVYQNKPYIVNETAGTKLICTCGLSSNQPYCDGSHKGTGKKPCVVKIEKDRRVAYCGCCSSREMPFCDGTHSIL